MSVRKESLGSSRTRVAFLAVVACVTWGLTDVPSFADSAATGGGADGSAGASGSGAQASQESGTQSVAAGGSSGTGAGTASGANASASNNGSFFDIDVSASAGSFVHGNKLGSDANAGLTASAGAGGDGGMVATSTVNGGAARARSSGGKLSASAYATNGASAIASSGRRGQLAVNLQGGRVQTYQRGNMTYMIARTDEGTYSIAIRTRTSVRAIAGSSENAKALASGQLRAILNSGMYVEAYASRRMTYSYASAWGMGGASGRYGAAGGGADAWAFASAVRTDNGYATETRLGNFAACGSDGWFVRVNKVCKAKRVTQKMKKLHIISKHQANKWDGGLLSQLFKPSRKMKVRG